MRTIAPLTRFTSLAVMLASSAMPSTVFAAIPSAASAVQQAYLKASNTGGGDLFGGGAALSGDTLVIGAWNEDSNAVGVNGNQFNDLAANSGAVYVFVRNGTNWIQQAYLKASNTDPGDQFGSDVAISGDTIIVGAIQEDSSATGVNGNGFENNAADAGAAYVFVRNGTNWTQQAYLKASNTGAGDNFGIEVAISGDTAVVGAFLEDSETVGVNGSGTDNNVKNAGAAYVFVRNGTTWTQQAYLKASNTGESNQFGVSVAMFEDTIVVGSNKEASAATDINGDQSDRSAFGAGAAYVFVRDGTNWAQQAYLKASNNGGAEAFPLYVDNFGAFSAICGDTIVVGAQGEDRAATGVNGHAEDNTALDSGAAYVFARNGTNWTQQAYLKASNTGASDFFGYGVDISGDTIVVGAPWEDSRATGINGDSSDNSAINAGAAYVFVRNGTNWYQQAYLKASNTEANDQFGFPVVVSGSTIVIGASGEDSSATGVNGNQLSNSSSASGAVYVFTGLGIGPHLEIQQEAGDCLLRFQGAPAVSYALQRASSVNGPWHTISTLVGPRSGRVEYRDPAAGTPAFYRVVMP